MNAPTGKKEFRIVGTRPVRPDGVDKVTGKAIFGTDFIAPGMLQGAILRSPHVHARIRSIDTSRAEALAGVKAVVTGADFPDLQSQLVATGETSSNILYASAKCMAKGKVFHEGQPVAAVAATSASIAAKALDLIVVDYEVLPHVIGIEEAMADGAPVLHDDMYTEGVEPKPEKPSNIASRCTRERGDAQAALAASAAVVSGRYSTEPVHQGYIEPHACVASWNADGQALIWSSSQGHYTVRQMTAQILDISQADIRAVPLEIGGGFGGKTTIYLEPVAMLLSRKSGRPVRLAMSRADIFRATGPAAGCIADITLGADADGILTAAVVELKYGVGAFPNSCAHMGLLSSFGHYRVENFSFVGFDVVSNIPTAHSYRAPNAPQAQFALESAIDELAEKLGMDPIDLRLKNAVVHGDPGGLFGPHGEIGFVECLEAAKAHPHWNAPLGPNQSRGVAAGTWFNFGGPSSVSVSLTEDGSAVVATGSPDIGGSRASMAIMAAETLQIPYEDVRAVVADTSALGVSMSTGGSRTTFATGKAVVEAAEKVIEDLKARAAGRWGVEESQVEWRDGAAWCLSGDKAGETLPIAKLAAGAPFSGGPISQEVSIFAKGWLPGFAVHICDTETDPETGNVLVVRYTAVQDVGRAIHPAYVEGQIQGGAVQGIGWALNEAYIRDADGKLDNPGFLDYRMPVCSDLPMIDAVMIEKPNPDHPYGVKGVGEVPIVPPLAAVAIAVSRNVGKRLRSLPLSPDRVHAAIG